MTPPIRITLLFTFALSVLTGCGEEAAAPAATPTATTKKKAVEAAPVVAATQVDYAYNPINKRDPFRPMNVEGARASTEAAAETVTCTEPLCLVDVDDLNVVAVVSGDANPLAMVEDRSGVGHIVRRNTRVGKQGGKVSQILRDCIVVTSFISGGPDGKPQANKQNMCVKTDSRSIEPLDLLKGKEFTQ